MRHVLLVAFAIVVSGCVAIDPAQPAGVADEAARLLPVVFDGYLHEAADVEVPGMDGVVVHLDLWRPDPATYVGGAPGGAEARVPVIVDAGPYYGAGKQGEERRLAHHVHDYIVEHMIPRGYALAAVETTGTGGSTGCWDFMGPQEVAGVAAAIDWLAAQPWSTGKVGMVGKSYDAMTQIMALSARPEALATAIPVAPLTHAYGGIYMNGVPYNGFWGGAHLAYQGLIGLGEVPSHTPERMPNYVARAPQQASCVPENFGEGLANDGDYNAYYEARDFRPSAADVTVPVFFMQGFLDENVHADNTFPYVNDLGGPTMVWLGQWYHDYANATFAGRDDMYLTFHRWLDRYLKDVPNGIERELGFHVQDSEGRWRRETSWPPADAAPLVLRLADGALAADSTASGAGASFRDAPASGDAVCALLACLTVPDVPDAYSTSVRYLGPAFDEETLVAGPVLLHLNASSTSTRGQVVGLLYDCDARGEDCALVTRGAMSLRHRNGLAQGEDLVPGETVTVSFELQPRDYVFLAGRAPALVLGGSDGDWFLRDLAPKEISISESAEAPSSIVFPLALRDPADAYLVSCGVRLEEKPCFAEGLEDRVPGTNP